MAPAPTPAPLSVGLLCAYKQYKADTEKIAAWLKVNAVKHGYKFDGQDGITIRTSDFVPMAQQIAADVKHTRFTLHPPVHQAFRRAIISRKQCTAWYEQNTDGQRNSNVKHAYFIDILITAWDTLLRAAADSSNLESKTLSPARHEGMPKARTAVAERNSTVSTTNRFASIYIDADGDEDNDDLIVTGAENVAFTDLPVKGKKHKSSYTVPYTTIVPDEGQIEEEFWFAIQSFLQEQQRIRQEVKRYWKDYRGNESHLIMASFGTRMAIDLIRRSEIELGLQVKRPARFPEDKYPVSAFPAMLVGMKQQGKQPFDAPLDGFVQVSSRLNELTLYNAYSALKTWCCFLRRDPIYSVDKRMFQKDDVYRLVTKISCIDTITGLGLPYEDDITRAVKKSVQCGEVPFWTSFALRLWVDIEDVLGTHLLTPWQDASRSTLKHAHTPLTHWHHQSGCRHIPLAEDTLDEDSPKKPFVNNKPLPASKPTSMLEKVRSLEGPRKKGMAKRQQAKKKTSKSANAEEQTDSCTCDACLRCGYDPYEKDVQRGLDWMADVDGGYEMDFHCALARVFDVDEELKRISALSGETIRTNPLHCGLLKYDLQRSRQVSALYQNTYDNRDLWTMMYIYAAGRSAFPDSLSWPDMEFLLFQQDEKHVFFGGRPKNIEWTARKWLLALGRSSNDYSYKDLGHVQCCSSRFFINFKKWRPLKDNSVLGRFFSSRMNCCDIHHAIAQDNFMEMIRTMHTPEALSRLARQLDMSQDEAMSFVGTWTSRLHNWTLKDILELTQMYLAVDLADIGFDWPALDSTCSEMWREAFPFLRIKHSDAGQDGGSHCDHDACDVGTQPTTWTTMILSQAAEIEINLSEKKKKNSTVFGEELEKGSPAFMKLWSLIQAHCRKRFNNALGHGIFSSFAAEEGLVKLLDTRNEKPYPARIVAPHVHKCFKGYPEDFAKQSGAMVLAKRVMASDTGAFLMPKTTKRGA